MTMSNLAILRTMSNLRKSDDLREKAAEAFHAATSTNCVDVVAAIAPVYEAEIESLRTAVHELNSFDVPQALVDARMEIDRLRAEVERLRAVLSGENAQANVSALGEALPDGLYGEGQGLDLVRKVLRSAGRAVGVVGEGA